MKSYSITRRLIATVLLVELVSALCITGLAFVYERHARFRAFDIMLRGRADSLLGAVQDSEDEQDNVMLDGTEINLPAEDIYEVWDARNRVLGRSPNWSGLERSSLPMKSNQFMRFANQHRRYRVIRVDGVRIVDPGDKNGGIRREVTIVYGAPTNRVWGSIWGAVEFYALTSLLLLLLTGSLMFWLLKRGLAPLHDLAVQAAGVSVVSWKFVPSDRALMTTELAPLARALETVLGGLERSFEQQQQFVSDAAHELKTAVAVVKSSLQLVAMKPRTVAEYEAGLERCQMDCDRLEELVAKMLTLARIEAESEADGVRHATDLSQTAQQTVQQFETMAEVNRLQLIIAAPRAAVVNVEAEHLQLLCSNLVLNALQHSTEGGLILVQVEQGDGWVELRVADKGSGIEPELLPHVFDRFYRSDPSRSRRTGGTGLGLSICKAIVAGAHGDIQIESEVGVGTTVLVRLPEAASDLKGSSV